MDKNPTQVVKEILSQRGMTQTDLARLTGTTLQNVRQLLSKDTLKISTLESFAKALNVPMWQFFATKDDILGASANEMTGQCPYCGKPITIETIIK